MHIVIYHPYSPSHSAHSESGTQSTGVNHALNKAIRKHLVELSSVDQDAFRQASKSIIEENLLDKIKAYDEEHKDLFYFRPWAEQLIEFLWLLDRFVGGIAIGIQASPDISSLGVRLVIDTVMHFVEFYAKLSGMLWRSSDWLPPLETYSKDINTNKPIVDAVAKVYNNLLKFCSEAKQILCAKDSSTGRWTTMRIFLRLQWEPFENKSSKIKSDLRHHLSVVLHYIQTSMNTRAYGTLV